MYLWYSFLYSVACHIPCRTMLLPDGTGLQNCVGHSSLRYGFPTMSIPFVFGSNGKLLGCGLWFCRVKIGTLF